MSDKSRETLELWWATAPNDVRQKRLDAMKAGRAKAHMRRRLSRTIKTCSACGERKPRAEFRRRDANVDGYQGVCKVCTAIRERGYDVASGAVEPTPVASQPTPKRPGWIYTIKALLGLAA